MAIRPINVVLLVTSTSIPEWQYWMLQRLLVLRSVRLRLVICDNSQTQHRVPLLLRGLRMVKAMDRLRFKSPKLSSKAKSSLPSQHRSLKSLYNLDQIYALNDPDLAQIFSEQAISIVLNPEGMNQLPLWLYAESQYGVWTHFFDTSHGAYDEWTGIRAYAQGSTQLFSGIAAQLEPEANSETVERRYLFLSSGSTHQASLSQSLDAMLWKMAGIVSDWVSRLRDSDDPHGFMLDCHRRFAADMKNKELDIDIDIDSNSANAAPDWRLLRQLFARCVHGKWMTAKTKIFTPQYWALLYGERSELDALERLVPPRDRYWADPQLIQYQQRYFVFLEEWTDQEQKGRIACMEWYEDGRFSAPVTVLEKDYHLSYPHLFQYEGSYYMVPESAENKTVDLYRCTRFPDRWTFVKSLMSDVEAYDATLHLHDGRWWMFVNMRAHEGSSPNDLLYLFSADSPLSQSWESHPCNPIVSTVSSARSAGSLIHLGGKIYRPSQDCAGSYGRGLNLNQVLAWNRRQYKERTLRQYIPDGQSQLKGMHTFSVVGNKILSDGIYQRRRWFSE